MMLELELLSLVKKHISGRSDVESAKIKPISLEFIKLHLSAIWLQGLIQEEHLFTTLSYYILKVIAGFCFTYTSRSHYHYCVITELLDWDLHTIKGRTSYCRLGLLVRCKLLVDSFFSLQNSTLVNYGLFTVCR